MSKGLNKVYLLGNVGDDPQLKQTALGTPYLRFRLATSERFKSKEEDWKEHTEWHTIVLWGNRAAGLAKVLRKGLQVMVEGTLRTTSYAKEGVTRFSTEVKAHDVCIATRADTSSRHPSQGNSGSTPQSEAKQKDWLTRGEESTKVAQLQI